MSLALRDYNWDVSYSHEDGDLVQMFYVPLLSRAKLYQRATGYFSGDVLALAARGLESLIERRGRMELLVGCTLSEEDVERIQRGYHLRDLAADSWGRKLTLPDDNEWARRHLGYLAWMIARNFLDVKLAIPLDENGRVRAGLGLYHAKAGIVTDVSGDQLVFKGSINETPQGWRNNCESFDVNCSWCDDSDRRRVSKTVAEFSKLWSGKARSARVMELPDALRERLLDFLPKDDTFVRPPRPLIDDESEEEEEDEADPDPDPQPLGGEIPDVTNHDELRAKVWAFIQSAPTRPDGALVAVRTSAVEPWPHQLRAYRRMLDSWPFRLLVADEVGLGKTIEAALLVRHVWISGMARRILIMVPKAVLRQWQSELYEKFNLVVPMYTGQTFCWPDHHGRSIPLEQPVDRRTWTQQPFVLVSSHLMRRRERQQELIEAEPWDLLVLDEAHHARRKSPGTPQEGGPNRLLRLMQQIKDKAKSLLLLTATPMQVHPVELWDLLDLLGLPASWNQGAFLDYFEVLSRNPDAAALHRAAKMFQAAEQEFGEFSRGDLERVGAAVGVASKLQLDRVLRALREPGSTIPLKQLSTAHRKAAIAVLKSFTPVSRRMSRHTRSLLRRYYERGLLSSPVPRRDVSDVAVTMTPGERALYDAVEDYISETYEAADANRKTAVGFVMTIYRRRLASSFHSLRCTLTKRLERLLQPQLPPTDTADVDEDLPQDETAEEVMGSEDMAAAEAETLAFEERSAIQDLIKSMAKLGTDSKALTLVEQLERAFADEYASAIVFTQYTDTMDWLRDFLADRLDAPIGCFSSRGGETRDNSGRWVRCSKEQIKSHLRQGRIKLLICTDAAGEGLNLQTCGVLVNYDLPWNPMKVEQRIGRIDRIGQRYPDIRVVNLAYADTVEADVYFALSHRIQLFHGLVGRLQPILSRLPKEFEASVLRRREERERGRHEAVHKVQHLVDEAESVAFDIDEVSDSDLQIPDFPACPLLPQHVGELLRRPELLPPGAECRELDTGTFALRLPGQNEPMRITADPAIFDEHFESHQLALYDSPIFRRVLESSLPLEQADLAQYHTLAELLQTS